MKNNLTSKKMLLDSPQYAAAKGRPILLRITFSEDFTKVDFGHQVSKIYVKGGWVRIAPQTFMRFQGEEMKYTLVDAINIPLAPNHLHFNTKKDSLYFSLLFPPVPLKNAKIDLIEAEKGDETDFNYYGIEINLEKLVSVL